MAKYRIEIKRSAAKEIKKIREPDLSLILSSIDKLGDNPRPQGAIKLTDKELYRIRVRNYRILYEVFDNLVLIVIVKVGHRRDIYK
jgi:mRNA interferase RelE/StbE